MTTRIKNLQLIIFDLDGTLVDSVADINNAINYAISPYGLKPLSVSDTAALIGEGITKLIEKIAGNEHIAAKDNMLERFIKYYSEHLTSLTRLYPGVIETLEKLSAFKKAVISNKRESMSTNLLRELGLLRFFDIVMGSDSVAEKKPSPLPVKKVLETFEIKPDNAIIVGDSDLDIQTGKNAGITTVAVTYGYRQREVLENADFVIDNINQLLFLIER